ncbi:MAG: hypothetical protein QW717_01100 [Candidatus Bathyarchaeia archaeon]
MTYPTEELSPALDARLQYSAVMLNVQNVDMNFLCIDCKSYRQSFCRFRFHKE